MDHDRWMQRCLQLARNGAGATAPNPMVGAVLMQGDALLAEGWHRAVGSPHAEVECLRQFGDGPVPEDAVMYVSLEPCDHTGLTPPCTELLIARGVRTVVMGCTDPDPRVAGAGLRKLRAHGIRVITPVLEAECRWTNRRFITSVEQGRPYVVLKWARSSDGFLDRADNHASGPQRISSFATDVQVHRWRSEEQAILVGGRTVAADDPRLNVRHVAGRSPLRVVLDRSAAAPARSKVFTDGDRTLLFTVRNRPDVPVEQVCIAPDQEPLRALLAELHRRRIRSVLVEGGAELLGHFLRTGLWDEAREITGDILLGKGTPAPRIGTLPMRTLAIGADRVHLHVRSMPKPDAAWAW